MSRIIQSIGCVFSKPRPSDVVTKDTDRVRDEHPKPEVHEPHARQIEERRTPVDQPPETPTRKEVPISPKPRSRIPWDTSQFSVSPAEGKVRFHDLGLSVGLMHAIADLGFEYCTPVQAAILPKVLAGTDATGRAQTGTGKTAAFLITIINGMQGRSLSGKRAPGTPRALILVPTRELALQVKKDASLLGKYSRCKVSAVFGGMDYQKQKHMLAEKVVDIVVATPGRLLDFKRQGDVDLSKVEFLVIDEADQMLDMGFIPDVRQIIQGTPPKNKRQTMLFGATLTSEVVRLASQWTRDPVIVDIDPEQVAVDSVQQVVYLVTTRERFTLLYNIVTVNDLKRVIVFCNRREQTRKLADRLSAHNIDCAVLSGDIAQKKRIRTLDDFRSGKIRILVATDVAGRGIHVEGVSHVINYNLPLDPEDYVHRIGRTGRAGASGISVSFATEDESFCIPRIEEFIGEKFTCVYPEDRLLASLPPVTQLESRTVPSRSHSTKPSRSRGRQRRQGSSS